VIRWITPSLATGPWREASRVEGVALLDVRDLIDGEGNSADSLRERIRRGVDLLAASERLIVACDWGVSRSNGIAAGILAETAGLEIDKAFRAVIAATGETDLKIGFYRSVREACGGRASGPNQGRVVAVLGAGGAIGRRLSAGGFPDLRLFSRADVDLLGDLTGPANRLTRAGVTDLLCLAQPARPFGRALVGGSVAITYGLLELARAIGARVVLPSSISVFAGASDGACLKRSDRSRPTDDFGVARWMSEAVAAECADRQGSPLLIVRLSHVYGGDNIRPSVLVNAAERLAAGEPVTLHRFANGLPALDLLHIDDAARALVAAARSTETGVVHVGSGRVEAVADVVALMAKDLPAAPQMRFEDKLGARRAIKLDELWDDPAIVTERTPLAVGARSMLQDRMTALRR